jgi:hypothetical protein
MLPDRFGLAAPDGPWPVAHAALRVLGVHLDTSGVWIDDDMLVAVFGPWRLTTTTGNIAGARTTGPYAAWRVIGARLSWADRGLTFGTSTRAGVCIGFHEPVPGIEPTGLVRHPSLTVTVADPELLVERLAAVTGRPG